MSLRGAYLPRRDLCEPLREELRRGRASDLTPALLAEVRAQHSSKIDQLRTALEVAGFRVLDEQAKALGLPRSTTWTIVTGKHKASGLSATIINRMLAKPELHPLIRTAVLEYVRDKAAGRYGHTKVQLRRFSARLRAEAAPRGASDLFSARVY
jgi:hypothetical protein